jgi:beta-glucosidase
MFTLSIFAAVAAKLMLVVAQSGEIITSDTTFYGESPFVVPPNGTGAGNWSAAYAKAKLFVAQLSVAEKLNFTAGVTAPNGCSG